MQRKQIKPLYALLISGFLTASAVASADEGDLRAVPAPAYEQGIDPKLIEMRKKALASEQSIIRAAHEGDPGAQHLLGLSYYHNLTGTHDLNRARGWFLRAAEKGVPEAQSYLGKMDALGQAGEEDHSSAINWYNQAADGGDIDAHRALGEYYLKGDNLLGRDYFKARDHFAIASRAGDSDAMVYLGLMHFEGTGVLQDYITARELLEAAAKQGDSYAQYSVGAIYYDGLGVNKNLTAAKTWFEAACDGGMQRGCEAVVEMNAEEQALGMKDPQEQKEVNIKDITR